MAGPGQPAQPQARLPTCQAVQEHSLTLPWLVEHLATSLQLPELEELPPLGPAELEQVVQQHWPP